MNTVPPIGRHRALAVLFALAFAGVSLADAVDMASVRPRQLLGLPVPAIEPGRPAELVVFEYEPGGALRVQHVL
jgi:N-acetylglucosamine-6-phosphate deacetylase